MLRKLGRQVCPLRLPLPITKEEPWQPFPLFDGLTPNLNRLTCHASVLRPGNTPHPPHQHTEEEILIVLSGSADLLLPDSDPVEKHASAGVVVYYPAHFPHSIRATGGGPVTYLMLKWRAECRPAATPMAHRFHDVGSNMESVDQPFTTVPIFDGATSLLDRMHCHFSTVASGAGYPAHADGHDVVLVLLDGEIATIDQLATGNDVCLLVAGEAHGMANSSNKPASYLTFEFHGKRTNSFRNYASHAADALRCRMNRKWLARRWDRLLGFGGMGMAERILPRRIAVDASTRCRLRCACCPVNSDCVTETMGPGVGKGTLASADFADLIRQNPWVRDVELANYGEIFLNPELLSIIQFAHDHNVTLRADTGVNLNHVRPEVLEALVKFGFRSLVVSIDGASEESYEKYRIGGSFSLAIDNVRRINEWKRRYESEFPVLTWQFIVFGHNEQELPVAQKMAEELGMHFAPKLSWEQDFSPVQDRELVRSHFGAADRLEYLQQNKEDYTPGICRQLWYRPQINWDGRVLGCSRNFWGDFGSNAFRDGLRQSLNSESMQTARAMLTGRQAAQEGIPCTRCSVYQDMVTQNRFLDDSRGRQFRRRARALITRLTAVVR